ncbi:MAG: hypothetical protein LT070_10770 [Solirubrobacteraceae bacterium]|nr:hypothetical protein [Solirubrobacteraceae bacterium]
MDGPGSEPETILAAYEQSAAAGLARSRFEFDMGWGEVDWGGVAERLPAWIRVAGHVAKPLMRRVVGEIDASDDPEEGIVDLAGHRSAMCPRHRPIAVVVGSRQWYGRPGDVLEERDSFAADSTQPLWLLSLLKGTVRAVPVDAVRVRGVPCRAFSVTADLLRASAATAGGLPSCEVLRAEDLLRLPLEVAIDDAGRIRRVAGDATFGTTGNTAYVVELWDFGAVPQIEWSRVPALEPPAH